MTLTRTVPQPRISIGLPVYNGEKYLGIAVRSLLEQDFTDFELIISDNASNDATREICCDFAARDRRVRYHRNEANIGASANFKRVFDFATAKYFKWAAHDDVHLPGFLRRTVEVLESAPQNVALVAPRAEIIDGTGQRLTQITVEHLDTRRPQPHQRVADVLDNIAWATAQYGLFRTEILGKTRLIDSFFASDRVLLVEIAMLGEIWEIPDLLFQHRNHESKSTFAHRTPRDLARFFKPGSHGSSRVFLRKRLTLEYARSIVRMPVPIYDRMRCLMVWFSREQRRLTRKFRNDLALRSRLQRLFGKKEPISITAIK